MSPQAQSVAMPKRLPLVQQFYTRSPNTPITQDSRLVNAYAEKDPTSGEYWVQKRLGIAPAPLYNGPEGFPQGAYYYQPTGTTLSVAGNSLFSNNIPLQVIEPLGTTLPWSFETIGGNAGGASYVMLKSAVAAYLYNVVIQSVTQITDANYPVTTVPGIAYLDATTYVMDFLGRIWGSAGFYNAAIWDGLNVIPASTKADQGIWLGTQLTYVIAMKQWTTQVFYDAENPTGSPLSPVPDAFIPFGCLHAGSVQKIDEILIWMTSNQTISPQIVLMENLSPKIISTPSIDRLLDNAQLTITTGLPDYNDTTIFSWSFKHAGHKFYGLTITSLNVTLVYDIDQGLWYVWTDANGNYWPFLNFTYTSPSSSFQGLHLAQVYPSIVPLAMTPVAGNVVIVDGDYEYPNDAGLVFPVDIYCPKFDAGTPRGKMLNMLYFEADQTAGSVLQARYSDNDYQSWSNFRRIDLNHSRPYLDQEGTFTSRAYHFRHQCNTKFRIKSGDLQMDLCTL